MKLITFLFIVIYTVVGACSPCSNNGNLADTERDAMKNFHRNREKMLEIFNFSNHIIPKNKEISIIFDCKNKDIHRFIIHSYVNNTENSWSVKPYSRYDFSINSNEMDTILGMLNWSRDNIFELRKRLDEVNCIGYSNLKKELRLNYNDNLMGLVSYVFCESGCDNEADYYKDAILFNNDSVLLIHEAPF